MTDLISREAALAALEWGDIYGRNAQAAIRALPAAQVKVKPLVWRDSFGVLRADTPFGDYKVAGKVLHHPGIACPQSVHGSLGGAQVAAQADYEARVLAVLDLSPSPVDASQTPDPVVNDHRTKIIEHINTLKAIAAKMKGGENGMV